MALEGLKNRRDVPCRAAAIKSTATQAGHLWCHAVYMLLGGFISLEAPCFLGAGWVVALFSFLLFSAYCEVSSTCSSEPWFSGLCQAPG